MTDTDDTPYAHVQLPLQTSNPLWYSFLTDRRDTQNFNLADAGVRALVAAVAGSTIRWVESTFTGPEFQPDSARAFVVTAHRVIDLTIDRGDGPSFVTYPLRDLRELAVANLRVDDEGRPVDLRLELRFHGRDGVLTLGNALGSAGVQRAELLVSLRALYESLLEDLDRA